MERTGTMYVVSVDDKHLDCLGDLGWTLLKGDGVRIGIPFTMEDRKVLSAMEGVILMTAKKGPTSREYLDHCGFFVEGYYNESTGEEEYRLTKEGKENTKRWRLEFTCTDKEPVLAATFGPRDHYVIMIRQSKDIDRFVPKEIIEEAKAVGAIKAKTFGVDLRA